MMGKDRPLVIGTRGGRLALMQTQIVLHALRQRWPGLDCTIQIVSTSGDRDRRTALWDLPDRGIQGFFTRQLEQALLDGRIDAAVHSLKDLPTNQPEPLQIAAIMDRNYPEDCLVCNDSDSIEHLPAGARIGTSSLRRAVQIRRIRADLELVPVRGNILTRLAKLDAGQVQALVLARAGLERLGLGSRIARMLDPHRFIPAPGQGALAVQVRRDDGYAKGLICAIDQPLVRILVEAERQVLIETGCGCHAPIGAFAEMIKDNICIHAFIADPDGSRLAIDEIEGHLDQSINLASQLAARLASRP